MGAETFGVPRDLVLSLKSMFNITSFVETGTNEGGTTEWAADHFDIVHTAEASEPIFARSSARLSARKNVTCHFGQSPAVLAKLIHELPPSIFWLDAHWCGHETAGLSAECPLIAEMSVIMPYFSKHLILVDDARLFLQPPPYGHETTHWPSLDDIFRAVPAQSYTVLWADTFLIAPAVYRDKIVRLFRPDLS